MLRGRNPIARRPWTFRRVLVGFARLGPVSVLDCLVVFAIYLAAAGIRTGGRLDAPNPADTAALAFLAGVLQVVGNTVFAVYWRDWSVAALEDLVALLKASLVSFATLLLIDTVTQPHVIPYAALFSGASVVVFVECALKLSPRWGQIFRAAFTRGQVGETVVIVGAGRTGQLLARDLLQHGAPDYRIVAFVDDDKRKWGRYVRGIRVEGDLSVLRELVEHYEVSLVVVAVAQPPGELVRRVVHECEGLEVRIRAVSGVSINGSDTRALRPLSIGELLGRETVDLSTPEARAFLRGKQIVVTGAAGSIGSELARQVIGFDPAALFLVDTNESGLHDLVQEIDPHRAVSRLSLMDIRDAQSLSVFFRRVRPHVIFHAAAYKHVPILEDAPAQGIRTNVIGTANLLAAARDSGVEHFVFISSDKAVRPSSVLGYTKRLGELLTIAYARSARLNYSVVRFGNVLGSSGSVVPIFERQIDLGGPVTITHPQATRFFMTSTEAAGLVIQAGAIARPGDLLVLDMGTPMLIADLARKMIRLRGLRTPGDVAIVHTGLRPGEKLHEELFFPGEAAVASEHSRVMRVLASSEPAADLVTLLRMVDQLGRAVAEQDERAALDMLRLAIEPDASSRMMVLRERAARERSTTSGGDA